MRIRGWHLGLAAVAWLFAAGCAEKLTFDRWQTLRVGATVEEVEATLGPPWQREEATWVYYDSKRHIAVTAIFSENRLSYTRWTDPDHGQISRGETVSEPGESREIRVQTIR